MFKRSQTLILLLLILGMFFAVSKKAEALTYTCVHDNGAGIGCGNDWYCTGAPGTGAAKCLATSLCTGLTPATITIPNCASTDTCGVCASCSNTSYGNGSLCGTYPSTSCVPAYSGSNPIANCGTYTADCSTTNVCNTCIDSNYTKCDSGARCQLNRKTTDAPVIPNCSSFNQCAVGQPCSGCSGEFALCTTSNSCVSNPSANLCASLVNCTTGQCATCVSGASRCAATNTCVADKICPSGQTFDPCAPGSNYCTGTANSLKIGFDSLRPDNFLFNSSLSSPSLTIPQSGYIGIGSTSPSTFLSFLTSSSGLLNMGGGRIVNLSDPIDDTDAVTKGYADGLIVDTVASSSFWQLLGNNIYYNGGSVGVGTTSPAQKLDVVGNIRANGIVQALQAGGNSYMFTMDAANGGGPRLQLGNLATPSAFFEIGAWNNINNFDSKSRDLKLFTTNGFLYITNTTGNVGIGTTNPLSRFHIEGDNPVITIFDPGGGSKTASLKFTTNGYTGSISSSWWNYGMVFTSPRDITQSGFHFVGQGGVEALHIDTSRAGVAIGAYATTTINAPSNGLSVSGYVGIGSSTPSTYLSFLNSSSGLVNMGSGRIVNLSDPIDDTDAVTKGYADDLVASTTAAVSSVGKFVGATTATSTGSNAPLTTIGYKSANDLCKAQYTDSHVCATSEIMNTISSNSVPSIPNASLWIFNGPPGFTATANDCLGRRDAASTSFGSIWYKSASNGEGYGSLAFCNDAYKLACCK